MLETVPYQRSRLAFRSIKLTFSGRTGPTDLTGPARDGITASIVQYYGNGSIQSAELVGTAFFVAPGVALTAAHVVAEAVGLEHRRNNRRILSTFVHQPFASPNQFAYWAIRKLRFVPNSDIAILSCEYSGGPLGIKPCTDLPPIPLLRLSRRIPSLGEKLLHAGIRQRGFDVDRGGFLQKMQYSMSCYYGDVFQVNGGNGGSFSPGPMVFTNSLMEGGTSGGPVFDSEGFVIGLLSTSMVGEKPFSRVSVFEPLEGERIVHGWLHGNWKAKTESLTLE